MNFALDEKVDESIFPSPSYEESEKPRGNQMRTLFTVYCTLYGFEMLLAAAALKGLSVVPGRENKARRFVGLHQ